MTSNNTRRTVVVCGAGPTGLMLAAELRLADVDVVILEKRPGGTDDRESRAPGVYARTVEIWDQRGILESFTGSRTGRYSHFALLPVGVDLGVLDSPHAVMLLPQARIERVLAERAAALGAEIRYGHAVTGLRQDEEAVEIEVTGPDGPYLLRAAYAVGCDGGRSTVRALTDVDFPGTDATADVLLADVSGISRDLPGLKLHPFPFVRTGRGWMAVSAVAVSPSGEDVLRFIIGDSSRPPVRRAEAPSFAEVCEAAAAVAGIDLSGATPHWVSRFGNTTRQAARYRIGRVLLAGDAAHVHPPFGGQGLNLGVQDAVNLGWKLAAEVHGRAPAGLLDSYERERHPVAARVLLNTRAQNALMAPGPDIDALRTVFAESLEAPEVNERLAGELSAVDVRYDLGDAHPLVGMRMPHRELTTPDGRGTSTLRLLERARGVLLDLSGDPGLKGAADGWAARVDTVAATVTAVAATGGTDGPHGTEDDLAAVLIRPDGHVAWAAPRNRPVDLRALEAALHRWFGPASAADAR
ncbi:FAD-dependent monooxygenase [Streptomyces monomycini]|uniref:FAD-dependent monooxygenase n=1 Tax=Streptomyces monomycini TaxID=371720 RepID=UPI0004AB380C|nr:FAD-dependent monooxygenase [Streptomyces monomycini]